ncbi:MAG: hypothetical protein J6S75_06495 [Thermoguttaceae bacterium]|nr:hypothetical protein [Thermoguttaceae bacterium]
MPSFKDDLYSKRESAEFSDGGEPKGGTGLLIGTLIVGLGSGLGIATLVTPPDPPAPEIQRPAAAPEAFTPGEINFRPPQNGAAPSGRMPQYVRPDGSELQIDSPPKEPSAPQEGENTPAPPGGENAPVPQGGEDTPAPSDGESTPAPQGGENAPAPPSEEDTPAA